MTSARRVIRTPGAVDVHFHGAFGIDLMTAKPTELAELSDRLWKAGVAGFCATTLSTPAPVLKEAVGRLGKWIASGRFPGALPLGIHLEGPFIHPHACGAHPPGMIRPLRFSELDALWEASLGRLKILTVAPERIAKADFPKLVKWSKSRSVRLSLGHSKATSEEATRAFDAGVRGVTHAWNALSFHHRTPGAMGAALGRKDVFLELIADQIHVAPSVMDWTRRIHPADRVLLVSDCVPAAATPPGRKVYPFGPLKIHFREGACRLPNGALAGGGLLLPDAFSRWAKGQDLPSQRAGIDQMTRVPLAYLGLSPQALRKRLVRWELQSGLAPKFHLVHSG